VSIDLHDTTKAYLEAWSSGDADAVAAFFTEDCEFVDHAFQETFSGRAAVRAFAAAAFAAIPDFFARPGTIVSEGDRVCYQQVFGGTQTGDFPGLPATGKPSEIPCMSIDEYRDGLISRHADYWSLATYLQQVGLMPAPQA
jgi:steroid delta-isomerase-like uncharacterized protein